MRDEGRERLVGGMRALGYVRVSRVGGREGDSFLSPELQRQSIARVCEREGLELVEALEELDRSGGDADRPLWNAAIERVERGEVGAIVVWNLDRFSRSLVDALGALSRIEAAGGRLYSEEGATPPMSFVLVDAAGRQVDVHPVSFDDERGGGVYVMDDGREWVYPEKGFDGTGRVHGRPVRCLSPEVQVLVHAGYELTDKDYRELDVLRDRFGVEVPDRPQG